MVAFRICSVISLAVWATSLSFRPSENEHSESTGAKQFTDTLAGRQLAMQYCQQCHLFPEPSLLDKNTWTNSVLPNMGLRLGIRPGGVDPYANLTPEEIPLLKQLNVFPETAALADKDWQKIVEYYKNAAPAEPLPQKPVERPGALALFKSTTLTIGDKSVPKTTLLKFNPATSQLFIGDDQNILYALNTASQQTDHWTIESAPTDIAFPDNSTALLLTIGKFAPSDLKLGRLMSLPNSNSNKPATDIRNLPRPVHLNVSDLNADGKMDALICGFGNHSGKLFWLDGLDPAKEHVVKALPGARKTEIRDLNKDKRPDVIALMSQAWEGVSVFYNKGKGQFMEKVVLQFPPSYGVNYFEMTDFNQDGFEDILLTNGDNWDLSPIKKNYHGIRIYLNDGKNNFKESWFYPLYGASKAIARDFDEDGDIDIAATSFYTDLETPAEGFVYLSNEGKLNFKPQLTPKAALGKWLTMEAADFDKDGDLDIVLGSYFHTLGEMNQLMAKGILSFPQLLVLTNQHK